MSREPLRQALRSLPRERAGADFTPRLLARLAAECRAASPPSALRGPRWRTAAAVVALAGLLAAGGVTLSRIASRPEAAGDRAAPAAPAPERAARRARRERIEAERARLATELAELKRMAGAGEPVIYLGGDDRVDLVVDVGRLARRRRSGEAGRMEPAAYRRPQGP